MQPATKPNVVKKGQIKKKDSDDSSPSKVHKTEPMGSPRGSLGASTLDNDAISAPLDSATINVVDEADVLGDDEMVPVLADTPPCHPSLAGPCSSDVGGAGPKITLVGLGSGQPGTAELGKIELHPDVLHMLTTAVTNSISTAVKASIDAQLGDRLEKQKEDILSSVDVKMAAMSERTSVLETAPSASSSHGVVSTDMLASLSDRVSKLESSPCSTPVRSSGHTTPVGSPGKYASVASPVPSYLAAAIAGASLEPMGASPAPTVGTNVSTFSPSSPVAGGSFGSPPCTCSQGYVTSSPFDRRQWDRPTESNLVRLRAKKLISMDEARRVLQREVDEAGLQWGNALLEGLPVGQEFELRFQGKSGHRAVRQLLQSQKIEPTKWKELSCSAKGGPPLSISMQTNRISMLPQRSYLENSWLPCMRSLQGTPSNATTGRMESLSQGARSSAKWCACPEIRQFLSGETLRSRLLSPKKWWLPNLSLLQKEMMESRFFSRNQVKVIDWLPCDGGGALCVLSWNCRGLLHHDPTLKTKKWELLAKEIIAYDVVFLQACHGTVRAAQLLASVCQDLLHLCRECPIEPHSRGGGDHGAQG